jgi:cyclohexanone monooxygenase
MAEDAGPAKAGEEGAVHDAMAEAAAYDAVVVGAGFAGLYMLHRLRGLGMRARAFEAGGDVGGTWYWNRYPGARCDVESMQYSYSFDDALQQAWRWSERYAGQPEILRYANHVADRFALRRDITFDTRVVAAGYDEAGERWEIETSRGARVSARFLVMATGCLSAGRLPDLPGRESFAGASFHTSDWPRDGVDFAGQRVGVIGTGSSAIQAIPVLAAQAGHLVVFQRTANYSVPARNAPLAPEYEQAWKTDYAARRQAARGARSGILYEVGTSAALDVPPEEREREYARRWKAGGINMLSAYTDLLTDADANETAAEFVRAQIRALVRDRATAERLAPRDYPIGTKRICLDTGYFETFNRDNVALVDIRADPIAAITPGGVRLASGAEHALDSLVYATGFDAMTGALLGIAITGRDGQTLTDAWAAGPRSYLGLMVAGFPNLFTVTGPGSPSVLSNMIVSIEQHVDWITDCLAWLRERDAAYIEATEAAQDAWVEHVNEVAHRTLYPRAASWYMGANVPGKPRVFMPYIGGVGVYRQACDAVAAGGYTGFRVGGARGAALAAE